MTDKVLYQDKDLKLIKDFSKMITDAIKQSTPRDLYEALLYGTLSDEEVSKVVAFVVDMFSAAVTLKLIPDSILAPIVKTIQEK